MKQENKVAVSAPGKLLLFGEHAVVYGKPSVVTAVDKRVYVTIEKTHDEFIWIEAPEVKVNGYKKHITKAQNGKSKKSISFVEEAVKIFFKKFSVHSGLKIETKSEFSSQFGFGSSSAVTAAAIFGLSNLFNVTLSKKELFDLSYEVILKVQKTGSGFDLAAAIYGGTLLFETGGRVIKPLTVSNLPFVVGYTGVKADTVTLINEVKRFKQNYPQLVTVLFDQIGEISKRGKESLEKKDWQKAGEFMNINQGLLDTLGVSSKELSSLIYAARDAGAYGAKLSGAGGGDCMVALSPENKRKDIERSISKAGGTVMNVTPNAKGVRTEE